MNMDNIITIIADSGATKTEWAIVAKNVCNIVETQGINPAQMNTSDIEYIVNKEFLPQLYQTIPNDGATSHNAIDCFFYGAGCSPERADDVRKILDNNINGITNIVVQTDMVGAAKAIAGDQPAIVCILGTGANSCLYDGKYIVKNVPPLGFILGDEGSGAYIGKRLLTDAIKQQLSENTRLLFQQEFKLNTEEVINKVYKEKNPNRFLASLSTFCAKYRHLEDIHKLLIDSFSQFFIRNVALYQRPQLNVNFVGSIAFVYQNELEEAAKINGFKIGKIIQKPIQGLVDYHKTHRI